MTVRRERSTDPNRFRSPLTAIVASMARRLGSAGGRSRHPGEPSSASPAGGNVGVTYERDARRVSAARLSGVKAIGAALAVLAATESITRAVADGASVQLGTVLCLLALATTLPLLSSQPRGAMLDISVACVLSVVPFHSLTIAGAIAELVAAYRLSHGDARLLAALVFVPFPVLWFTDSGHGEGRLLTIALALLIPRGGMGRRRDPDPKCSTRPHRGESRHRGHVVRICRPR